MSLYFQQFEHMEIFARNPLDIGEMHKKMSLNIVRVFADMTKIMPSFEAISQKLERSIETIYPKIFDSYHQSDEQNCFVTLCHGDLWSNNIMFRTDATNGSIIDAILCDYQVSFSGPAVIDIANTLYTSSHVSLRDHDYDQLVQVYHRTLSETLSKLKYTKPTPTLNDIQVQLLRRGICQSLMGLFGVAARAYDKFAQMDIGMLMDDSEGGKAFWRNMTGNVKDNEGLKFLLNYFDRRGYFD